LNANVHNIVAAQSTVFAFPNPANGNLNITWNAIAAENGTITITDITGRELINANVIISLGQGVKQFDMSGYANGMYLVYVKSASIDYSSKIQVQH
jgi:Secretion system C-terminal sorting domain